MRYVAVLMGGPSSEHEVSMRSGQRVYEAIRSPKLAVVVGKDGSVHFDGERAASLGAALDRLKAEAELCFVAMHGAFGEDGTIQALLDAIGVGYVGSGVLGSSLAMDKLRAKRVYRGVGLPTAPDVVVERAELRARPAEVLARIEAELGFPCVLKPLCSGSSVGVSFPASSAELKAGLEAILAKDRTALVEKRITGREFTCGVIEHAREGYLEALPVTEIVPDPKYTFFDYEAKYTPGATNEITPARIDAGLRARIQSLAVEAHRWLGCLDFSRSDFMVDEAGAISVLETNTIPGLTAQSLVPQAAKVAGYEFDDLIAKLLDNARARRA